MFIDRGAFGGRATPCHLMCDRMSGFFIFNFTFTGDREICFIVVPSKYVGGCLGEGDEKLKQFLKEGLCSDANACVCVYIFH